MRRILNTLVIATIIASSFTASAEAQSPEINFGIANEIVLVAETANQRVDFFATNVAGRSFDTFEMFVLIGDGGALLGGQDTGPGLSGVELGEAGTLFEGGNRGTFGAGSQTPLVWADFIDGVQVTSDGQLGTFIFDTTGFDVGDSIDIQFGGFSVGGAPFDSNFRTSDGTRENVAESSSGRIVIVAVPEPSSAILMLTIAGIAGLRRKR